MKADLLIRGGTVYDGLGGPGRLVDVAISDDRIVTVGDEDVSAHRTIDAQGLAVTPGFIDPHSHSDLIPFHPDPQPFKLFQGVTTEIVGNCGCSYAPLNQSAREIVLETWDDVADPEVVPTGTFADYLSRVEAAGPTNHVAALVGHGVLRLDVNGVGTRLDDVQNAELVRLAAEALDQGAFGVSTGLIYVPGAYAPTDELVAVAAQAGMRGLTYASHIRDEGSGVLAAAQEALQIGRDAGVGVQVSHCKIAGARHHGGAQTLIDLLVNARAVGLDVTGDQYPYLAGATLTSALFPPEVFAATGVLPSSLAEGEPVALDALRRRFSSDVPGRGVWPDTTPDGILIATHVDAALAGRTVADIASNDDPLRVLCQIVAADPTSTAVLTMMGEPDVRTIMANPLVAIGSDSGMPWNSAHPRTFGTFPHFLGRYIRELGVVPMGEAVRKMTSLPARRFRIPGRGIIRTGAIADITVFNESTIGHSGTYTNASVRPTGIHHVILAGSVVLSDGVFCDRRAGRVLHPNEFK